jgi:hypothetical protein
MAQDKRTYNLGRKAELEEEIKEFSIKVDSAAKAFCLHLDPMDRDLKYVENIDLDVLRVNMKTICENKVRFERSLRELKDIKRELGEE